MKRKVQIIPPEEVEDLKLGEIKKTAAGIPAVTSSIKHIREEIGFIPGLKILNKINQKGGFDCPGCAWPDPDNHRSKLGEYCENGAKAIAEEATIKRVDRDFFSKYTVEELSTKTDFFLGRAGRITEPFVLKKGSSNYEPISWENAFSLIGDELNKLDSPNEAIFYTSGRTSNEAAFMYQLFARAYGTNNLPDCSNMCHESSGAGLSETVGIGKGSVKLEDLYIADVIMVIGQNPGTNHPRMLSALKKCKQNGGKIISVNPIPESGNSAFSDPQSVGDLLKGGTKLTDHFLQVKINGDIALLKGLMKLILDADDKNPGSAIDHDFIKLKTECYEDFLSELRKVNVDECSQKSGIPFNQIKEVAELLIAKKKIIICWAMGLTQHENGVQNIREVVNLLLMKGAIGKPGAGTCPVRGHSNVQGDRTMGIYEKPAPKFLDSLDKHFGIKSPREHGYDVVDAIKAMAENKAKVFIGMGGNFISATPDSQFTGEAMQNCNLSVHVSTKLNRAHIVTGEQALILPCLGRTETDIQKEGQQFVTVENSMGVVHSSKGTFKPATENLMSEPAIVAGIAKATLKSNINWTEMADNYDNVRDNIEAVIPGFNDYNKRVKEPKGFYLPNGARTGNFTTLNGKAKFTVNEMPNRTVKEGNFVMMTIRSHDQYNTTIYGMDDRYRGIFNERRVVLMHKDDIISAGFKPKDLVDITSYYNGVERVAHKFYLIPYDIAQGSVATYFPETNCLVPIDSTAKKSNTPASKFIEVSFSQH